jgi:hypothetical protein
MAITITAGPGGDSSINYGRPAMVVNPPQLDEASGEYVEYEPEIVPVHDPRYFDPSDALPPEYQHRPEISGNPFTDPSSTEADIRAWVLTPGEIDRATIDNILTGMEQNGASDNTRDLISELLAFKEGGLGVDDLSEAALEFLDVQTPENSTPADEILDSLSEDAQRQLEQVDEETMNDLRATGNELLGATPDYSLVDQHSQAAEQCYQNADTEGAFVYALAAQFHSGQLTAAQAVQEGIKRLGLTRGYNALLRLQQGDNESIEYGYTHADDYDTYDTDY